MAPFLDHHEPAAFLASDVRDLVLVFHHRNLRVRHFQGFLKGHVEFPQHCLLVGLVLADGIQLAFHVGTEGHIDEAGKIMGQYVDGLVPQRRGHQLLPFLGHVPPGQDGLDDGGIGAGAADALFFQFLDQGGFRKVRRRFRKVLHRFVHLDQIQFRPLLQGRYLFVLFLVLPVHQFQEPVELHHRACGFQFVAVPFDGEGGQGADAAGHLAGHGALPDQGVQPQLIPVQKLAHLFRGPVHAGGPDGLMGLLGILPATVHIGLLGQVAVAVVLPHIIPDLRHCRRGQVHRVGTHVGDQAHRTLPSQGDPFVQLLGQHHDLLRGEVQLLVGLLLQAGGGEGRRRFPHPVPYGTVRHLVPGLLQILRHLVRFLFVVDGQLFSVLFGDFRRDFGRLPRSQGYRAGPVFLGLEVVDGLLPVADDLHGHALDTAGGDFMEGNPAGRRRIHAQDVAQMPGDSLPFPVRVRCQIDLVGLFGQGLQFLDQRTLAPDIDVFGCEIMLHVHPELALGQVTQMAHGGTDGERPAQELLDGFGFGRGFHDDQFVCHDFSS